MICGVTITVGDAKLHYEAHSYHRVAEILASQLKTLSAMNEDYGHSYVIDDFVIHHFIKPDNVFEKWVNEQELSS